MSFNESININNEINRSLSINEELNPIVVQLIEFGYDNKYSRRVFHYFHPEDLEEALNYMAIDNGIIQHRFIKDNRNKNNELCYICGEKEEIHLKELNFFGRSINNNNSEINNDKNNDGENKNDSVVNIRNPKEKEINNPENINLESIKNSKNSEIIKDNNFYKGENITKQIKNTSIGNQYLNDNDKTINNNININNNQKNLEIIKVGQKFDRNKKKEMNITSNSFKNINNDINNNSNNFDKNSENFNFKKINNEIKENEQQSSKYNDSFSFKKIRILQDNSSSEREYLNYSVNSKINKINKDKKSNKEMNNDNKNKNDDSILKNSVKSLNIENKNNNLKNNSAIEKKEDEEEEKVISEVKKECSVCGDEFIENKKNRVKKCGHSFCEGCWYDFLSIKIKENKLPTIKCLDFNCQSKLDDEFIMNLLNSDTNLIKKYKKYKLELEVINDPNKKLCPFPNCDSFLELKEIKNQYVTCENNHTYCFECLKEPHGNLPCNEKVDNSIIEYAKNNFVKKCPNCGIITEKQNGCNHITCSKCQYQWCWLCNQKYENNHFNEGKCKGFQFFKPKNEYEIKLMMEGKINSDELSESQWQDDDEDDFHMFMLNMMMLHFHLNNNNDNINSIDDDSFEESRHSDNINIPQNNLQIDIFADVDIYQKILYIIIFLFFGNIYFIIRKYQINHIFHFSMIYLLLEIALFFPLIYLNIISFIFILIFKGFKKFILTVHLLSSQFYTKEAVLIISNLYLGIFCNFYFKLREIIHDTYILDKRLENIIAFFPSFITLIVLFFPNIIFYNFIYMIILYIKEGSFDNFLLELDSVFENSFNFQILKLNHI